MRSCFLIALLAVAGASSGVAEPLTLPSIGVTFDRSSDDPPIAPEIRTYDLASLASFVVHDTMFTIMRANAAEREALPVTDPERQRSLLDASRDSGLIVTHSGITQLAGGPAFFTVANSAAAGRASYQYSLTLMKAKRTFRFTLISVVEDPRNNAPAIRLLNSATIQ